MGRLILASDNRFSPRFQDPGGTLFSKGNNPLCFAEAEVNTPIVT